MNDLEREAKDLIDWIADSDSLMDGAGRAERMPDILRTASRLWFDKWARGVLEHVGQYEGLMAMDPTSLPAVLRRAAELCEEDARNTNSPP